MRGNLLEIVEVPLSILEAEEETWEILQLQYFATDVNQLIMWSGSINETRLLLLSERKGHRYAPLHIHSAIAFQNYGEQDILYTCFHSDYYQVGVYRCYPVWENDEKCLKESSLIEPCEWVLHRKLPRFPNDEKEVLLQLKLDSNGRILMGTTGKGFVLWDLKDEDNHGKDKTDYFEESGVYLGSEAIYLPLPHGVRNITTNIMQSNSIMLSSKWDYAVAGVRKNLYVWCLETRQLAKVLDAHFGRIIQLEALTVGNWNNVVTSSIDRSIKVWNINNIFEKVHIIDRHELQIDDIR